MDQAQKAELRRLSAEGTGLIVVQGMFVEYLEQLALELPGTRFATGQVSDAPNIAGLTFVDAEPSFLAGAAAALKSETGTIGYIGGVDWDGIWGFQAGYEAGARAIDPDIRILVEYLSVGDFTGFGNEDRAKARALEMYRDGADIIFHAAGTAGLGVFDAAVEHTNRTGDHVWVIGVDQDQYETVTRLPGATNASAWRRHILTSVVKGADTIVYAAVAEHAEGRFTAGPWRLGLASGATDLSYSGGFIDDIRPRLEDLKAQIIAGEIVVPCIPPDRLDAAAELGIGADDCHG